MTQTALILLLILMCMIVLALGFFLLTSNNYIDLTHKRFNELLTGGVKEGNKSSKHNASERESFKYKHLLMVNIEKFRLRLQGLNLHDNKHFERNFLIQAIGICLVSIVIPNGVVLKIALASTVTASYCIWRWRWLAKQQLIMFEEQLPQVTDQLRRAVHSGLSVNQALSAAANSAPKPISVELGRITQQLKIGISLPDIMEESKKRIQVKEFHFLGMILVLNQHTGGQLSEALNNLSQGLRERKSMRMKLLSLTSEPRTTAWIVSSFPVIALLGLYFFSPNQIDFFLNDPAGNILLLYVATSISIGLIGIHNMAKGNV